MAHTADDHCKMIVGLAVADLAWQLAIARAEIERLQADVAALTAKRAAKPPPKDPA